MSRIFLSHSSANNAEAVALRDWLRREGWDDVFLDIDPERGIAAGERWERALNQAASRCEAVLFLVSRAWLGSGWCLKEFNLAHRLNKRLFGVLIEDLPIESLPVNLTSTWQMIRLATGRDHIMLRVTMPVTGEEAHRTFSAEGLARLKTGLQRAGLDARFFAWPPDHDSNRPPFRGLLPLEAEDAGIFFGRDAPIVEALDRLRGMRAAAPPRLLVILGASGSGKSSFLRAGLLPRLQRDDRNFLVAPVIRPQHDAIDGESGLVLSMDSVLRSVGLTRPRAEVRMAIEAGAPAVRKMLSEVISTAVASQVADGSAEKPPIFILPIDQGEELFLTEGGQEAERLLTLLRDLLAGDFPAVLALVTMRSDSYERLQSARSLEGIAQATLSLPPMPRGAYNAVIEGPASRLCDTNRALTIDPALTQALLSDIESGGGRDALPLLAFTLERLFLEYGGRGRLMLADYQALGGIKGSIEAAVKRAFVAGDADPAVPKDHTARLALLRRGLIPWLAGIDPDTKAPRRRVARLSEIPVEARPLIRHLVEQRLLATDVAKDTRENTIEPAHEALLRQWGLLQGWLAEDAGLLAVLEGVKRASRDWAANARNAAWLTHTADRLAAAERLIGRPDLAANLEPTDQAYLAACRQAEYLARWRARRLHALIIGMLLLISGAGVAYWSWTNRLLLQLWTDLYLRQTVLSLGRERTLLPLAPFQECTRCPEMVVVQTGNVFIGSTEAQESPPHQVTIAKAFAVSKFEVTFAQWDACYELGGCRRRLDDYDWGRGTMPVMFVGWDDAQQYAKWLTRQTGKEYRLLTEAEYEYAARAGSATVYYWGDKFEPKKAHCADCSDGENSRRPISVGSFTPNSYGLYDMLGNVSEWVADCWNDGYDGAPKDGSAWMAGDCSKHVVRGGSYKDESSALRASTRSARVSGFKSTYLGFRVARTLNP